MDNASRAVELAVGAITVSSVMGWLTPLGALVGIVYYSVKLFETETVKILTGRKDIL